MSFVLLGLITSAWAQRAVSGKVTSEEGPLPGVAVRVKGTSQGAVTDVDGNYRLEVPSDKSVLVFSFIGYADKQVPVGNQSVINVVLAEDVEQLAEVVVTGYNTITEEKSSIATSTVSAKTIENRPNASFAQSLSGQVAGLNITTSSGQPGGNSTINLRGVGSISGATEPLFIMDGIPVDEDNFRSLNPNDIESVTVLKDAGATAIYGNRGANGVVVITTKAGKYNSGFRVNYSGRLNFTKLQESDYSLLNSQEQLELERLRGRGRGKDLTDEEIAAFATTDWVDYFFDAGVSQAHDLSITSGTENLKTYTSFGYLNQDGVLQNSSLERYNLRTNIEGRSASNKLTYGVNATLNFSKNNEPNSIGTGGINQNFVLGAYQSVPYISPLDYVDGRSLLSPLSFANTPLFLIDKLRTFTRIEDEIKSIASIRAGYEITKGLRANITAGFDFTDVTRLTAQSPVSFNSLLFAQSGNETPGYQAQQNIRSFAYNVTPSLLYSTEFAEKHTISLGVYGELFKAYLNDWGFRAEGQNPKTFAPGVGSGFVGDNSENDYFIDDANADRAEAGLTSYFAQADYDYGTRYGIAATIRRDASYRFVDEYKWGTFYSIAGRWNVHNEAFMTDSPFDVLKLRGSYGKTGNQNIVDAAGQFAYFAAPDLYRDLYETGTGYGGQNAILVNQIGNRNLRWETIYQANIGLDMEMFKSRLRASFDVYTKTTEDLYLARPVSAINSVTELRGNNGELENRGVDFLLSYDVVRQGLNGFNLTVGVLGNYNKQEIIDLPTEDGTIVTSGSLTGLREGGPLLEYYTYRYAGVNPDNGNLLFLTAAGEVTESPNVNTDRVWLGSNIYPDVQGGINLDLDYKGIFLTTQWTYTMGVERFDFDYSSFVNPNSIGQFRHSRDLLDAWTPENTDTDIPSLTAANYALGGNSTRFLTDSDYLRLRLIQVGYTLPTSLLERAGVRAVRIFANAENLITFTKWRGFDAESLNPTGSRLYPSPKIIQFGLEVGF